MRDEDEDDDESEACGEEDSQQDDEPDDPAPHPSFKLGGTCVGCETRANQLLERNGEIVSLKQRLERLNSGDVFVPSVDACWDWLFKNANFNGNVQAGHVRYIAQQFAKQLKARGWSDVDMSDDYTQINHT